jgi:hypothetical protein
MKYQAKNVHEAVAMADAFKAEGKYNWFRGQTQTWPPHSSLFRVQRSADSAEARLRVRQRHEQFFGWLQTVPELAYLADLPEIETMHATFAILQHYGVPTHYIDFTTDPGVAAFFAGDTAAPNHDEMACIYCLDTNELLDVWDGMKGVDARRGAELEVVTIDLSQLWRLQAQHGTFVYCNYNWEVDFPMDCICFPFSGCPSYPTRDAIYPEHKSPLEIVLDRYFEWERGKSARAKFREMFEQVRAKNPSAEWIDAPSMPGNYHPEVLRHGELPVLESWQEHRLKSWQQLSSHDWSETSASPIRLNLSFDGAPAALGEAVSYTVGRVLKKPDIRSKRLDWDVVAANTDSAKQLSNCLREIWNGMRWLPFTDQQIQAACGGTAALLHAGFSRHLGMSEQEAMFAQLFGPGFTVEFGTANEGNASRGVASREALQKALRADLRQILKDEYVESAEDVRKVLSWIYSPMRLFEFQPFVDLFAAQIIPTQVLSRSYVVYSPAELETFGLP